MITYKLFMWFSWSKWFMEKERKEAHCWWWFHGVTSQALVSCQLSLFFRTVLVSNFFFFLVFFRHWREQKCFKRREEIINNHSKNCFAWLSEQVHGRSYHTFLIFRCFYQTLFPRICKCIGQNSNNIYHLNHIPATQKLRNLFRVFLLLIVHYIHRDSFLQFMLVVHRNLKLLKRCIPLSKKIISWIIVHNCNSTHCFTSSLKYNIVFHA